MPENASFDTWTSLFLIVSALGFFLSFILSTNKKALKNNWPIILVILGFSLIMIYYVMYWTGYKQQYPYIYTSPSAWLLAFGPLLHTYIAQFYNPNYKVNYIHFVIPIFVLIFDYVFLFSTNGYTSWDHLTDNALFRIIGSLKRPWIAIISMSIYAIQITENIKNHSIEPKQKNTEMLRSKWARIINYFFGVFILAYASYFILVHFSFFNAAWDYAISLTMTIGIYGTGYMVFKEQDIFNGALFSSLFLNKNNDELTDETKDDFYNILQDYIAKEKPYLNNDLRLVTLADKLGYSSHLLSQIINEKANKNFNQFINDYRLQEAESLLQTTETPIKTIFYQVGFNNKTTFINAFKRKFGCTPSAYKKLSYQ